MLNAISIKADKTRCEKHAGKRTYRCQGQANTSNKKKCHKSLSLEKRKVIVLKKPKYLLQKAINCLCKWVTCKILGRQERFISKLMYQPNSTASSDSHKNQAHVFMTRQHRQSKVNKLQKEKENH